MAKKKRTRGKDSPQLDIATPLTQPVMVGRNGKKQSMSSFEVRLSAQVRKAIKEESLPAIENVLRLARRYDLVMPPSPAPLSGGVLVVPGRFAPGSWAALFEKPRADSDTES